MAARRNVASAVQSHPREPSLRTVSILRIGEPLCPRPSRRTRPASQTPSVRCTPPTRRTASVAGPESVAALQVRDYRLYLTSQMVATTGLWMQRIAQDWLVLELTGSVTAVGVAVALQFLPMLLFGLLGGVVADRYPKRTILIVTQSTAATGGHHPGYCSPSPAPSRPGTSTSSRPFSASSRWSTTPPGRSSSPSWSGSRISATPSASTPRSSSWAPWWVRPVRRADPRRRAGLVVPDQRRVLPARGDDGGGHPDRGPHRPQAAPAKGQLREALRYIGRTSEVAWTIVLAATIGLFGLNMPVILAAFADHVFSAGVRGYSLFNSLTAVGASPGADPVGPPASVPRLRMLRHLGRARRDGDARLVRPVELAVRHRPGGVGFCTLLVPHRRQLAGPDHRDPGAPRSGDECLPVGAAGRSVARRTVRGLADRPLRRPAEHVPLRRAGGPRLGCRPGDGAPLASHAGAGAAPEARVAHPSTSFRAESSG